MRIAGIGSSFYSADLFKKKRRLPHKPPPRGPLAEYGGELLEDGDADTDDAEDRTDARQAVRARPVGERERFAGLLQRLCGERSGSDQATIGLG